MLDHIREAIWADLMQVSVSPGGSALSVERVNRLLGMEQEEVDRIVFTLADLLPDKFSEAMQLACDCVPLPEREEVPYPEKVRGVGGEWVTRGLAQFQECFAVSIEGGRDLAAEIERAGGRRKLASEWGVPTRSVGARVRRILRDFHGAPELDGLAVLEMIWRAQESPAVRAGCRSSDPLQQQLPADD